MNNRQSQMNLNSIITTANILLVILVAIGSFSLSYSALSDLASKNGYAEWRAYVLPLVIDIGMLAFGLAVVHAHLHGTNPLRRRLLNILYTLATTIFNLAHAPNTLLAHSLAIIPPLTLFFTFEVLMAMIEHNIKSKQQQATLSAWDNALSIAQKGFSDLAEQTNRALAEKDNLITELDNLYNLALAKKNDELTDLTIQLEIASDPVAHRRQMVYEARQGDQPTPYKVLAEQFNVTEQTIKNDVVSYRNGVGG